MGGLPLQGGQVARQPTSGTGGGASSPIISRVRVSGSSTLNTAITATQAATSANARTRPLAFLRSLGCVDSKLRRDTVSKACKGFRPATLDGIAYHPHSTTFAPDRGYTNVDDANLADYPRLVKTIDGVQRAGGLVNGLSASKKFDIHYDEYGYQTNPPDALLGVTTAQQASWLQWSAYTAYRQPRVRTLIQYLWRDDPINTRGWR